METGERNGRSSSSTTTSSSSRLAEADLFLKWGNKKRLRCVRVRDQRDNQVSPLAAAGRNRRKISSRFLTFADKDTSFLHQFTRPTRNSEVATLRSENRKTSAVTPEKYKYHQMKEEKGAEENRGAFVWPKLFISLSNKEKEEDFMAMKGCRLPHRPKKRAKLVQRTLLLVSPGAWLSDMCLERYEVREKKTSKKKGRGGLKAMGSMESDSE